MPLLVRYSLLFWLAAGARALPAQSVSDSLNSMLNLIDALAKDQNYERAQVESENLRTYLAAHRLPCPAAAVPLLSAVYRQNKDEKSALAFLDTVARDARNDNNPKRRAELLRRLVDAYSNWRQSEHALACQQLLAVAQDSIAEQERRMDVRQLHLQMDSLNRIRTEEMNEQARFFHIERNRAFFLAGAVLLAFLGLALANSKSNSRWRKRLAKKDLEMEFLRSDRYASILPADPVFQNVAEPAETQHDRGTYFPPDGKRPDKKALVIEPNRQIVLYLKSLLSDRFELETATTANEGLMLASQHLPDLIICDAVLNGKTGFDVVRQIKLAEQTNHIPVILLSTKFGNEGKLDALRAGADAWFTRPVLDDEFDLEVTRLLDVNKAKHDAFSRFLHLFYSENRLPLADPFLQRTVEHIEQQLSDPDFLAGDLARKMQMPKPLFNKKLEVLTGKEPMQLIREMRLEKAKVLLEKRAGTPQAIAELVGFSSAGSFALAFKDYFGENTSLLQMPPGRG